MEELSDTEEHPKAEEKAEPPKAEEEEPLEEKAEPPKAEEEYHPW